jgi:hypothetical protein
MKKISYLLLLISISQSAISQKIIRQSINCLGLSYFSGSTYLIQQSIGQSSNTTIFYNEKSCVRQGFLQPLNIDNITNSQHISINLTVFPNPASDNFTIGISGSDNTFTFNITDILGQTILTSEITENNEQIINSTGWNKGVYFINIYSGEKLEAIKKIIKI